MLKKISRVFKKLKRTSSIDINCSECKGNDYNAIECSICLDHIHKNNKSLVCGHAFHTKCIDNWLKVNYVCPICRRNPNDPIPGNQVIVNTNANRNNTMIQDLLIFAGILAGEIKQKRYYFGILMCSDLLIASIEARKRTCEQNPSIEKKIEFSIDDLTGEDFEFLHEKGYQLSIDYDLTYLRLDPRVFAGYERDSCNEKWIISWD